MPAPAAWAVAVLGGMIAVSGAFAQSFTGVGPAPRLVIPNAPRADPERTGATTVSSAPVPLSPLPGAAEAALPRVLNFQSGPSGFRLSGEEAALTWPLFLTEAQAASVRRMRVGYLSAISVASETSNLVATVNDTMVGRTDIRAPGAVKIVEFDVPAGVLKPGFNAVRLATSQRHRVDCSLPGTYELWTQIDPARTGMVIPDGLLGPQLLRDLPAITPDDRGGTPIRVVLGERPSVAGLERVLRAVQAVTLAGRFSHPIVDFGSPRTVPAGLDLLIGTTAEIRKVPDLGPVAPGTGPRVQFIPGREGRAAMLVITGESDDDVAQAVATLRSVPQPGGTPSGLQAAALFNGAPVNGGELLPLSRFGVSSREFSGRLIRIGFNLAFPSDFLSADYAKARLSLAGGYASGLLPGSQIMIDVNGRNTASMPLSTAAGDMFRDADVQLPLSRFRPGFNRVEVTAEVPSSADRACDTTSAAESRERFLFLDTTTLALPNLARALRMPDLAATTSGAGPYVAGSVRPRLVMPVFDADTVAAAATLVARLSVVANRIIDFEASSNQQLGSQGATLLVAPARALDPSTVSALGLDPDQIRSIWQTRAEATPASAAGFPQGAMSLETLRRNIPSACTLPTQFVRAASISADARPSGRSGGRTRDGSGGGQDLVTKWDGVVRPRAAFGDVVVEYVRSLTTGAKTSLAKFLGYAKSQFAPGAVRTPSNASLIVGQGLLGQGLSGLVTLVTAPNAKMLRSSVTCLVDPVVWNQIQGRFAFLDGSDGSISTVDVADSSVVATQDFSVGNARLVTAGWLSMNPWAYVGLTLSTALCLGFTTTNLVRNIGRRTR